MKSACLLIFQLQGDPNSTCIVIDCYFVIKLTCNMNFTLDWFWCDQIMPINICSKSIKLHWFANSFSQKQRRYMKGHLIVWVESRLIRVSHFAEQPMCLFFHRPHWRFNLGNVGKPKVIIKLKVQFTRAINIKSVGNERLEQLIDT